MFISGWVHDGIELWESAVEEFNKRCSYYSDFHKDFIGCRPRDINMNAENFRVNEWSHDTTKLEAQLAKVNERIAQLEAEFKAYKATPQGRAQLEADGWTFTD